MHFHLVLTIHKMSDQTIFLTKLFSTPSLNDYGNQLTSHVSLTKFKHCNLYLIRRVFNAFVRHKLVNFGQAWIAMISFDLEPSKFRNFHSWCCVKNSSIHFWISCKMNNGKKVFSLLIHYNSRAIKDLNT